MSGLSSPPDRTEPLSPVHIEFEQRRLEFEYYKAKLDFRKFELGSVFVAVALAVIPPGFQLATARLESVRSEQKLRVDELNTKAERLLKQQTLRDEYIKAFLSNGLSQDVELRIRFADYFAHVSTEPHGWEAYRNDLIVHRDQIRAKIDLMEADWRSAAQMQNEVEINRLERNLQWAYKEVGYIERNRSVAGNPRAPETSEQTIDQLPPRPKFGLPTVEEKARLWNCNFKFSPSVGSAIDGIQILGDWEASNIVSVPIPQLQRALGSTAPSSIRFNTHGAEALKAAWAEIEEKNLPDRLLSFDGAFYPRFIRGSTTTLSNHSCGTAFDINAGYHRFGGPPLPIGQKGSVLELVPIFNKYGFHWGGHNSGPGDSSHFELAAPLN